MTQQQPEPTVNHHHPDLAVDASGQPLELAAEATAWRARRGKEGPGRPGLVCNRLGQPVTLPLDATHQDLYDVAGPGKYFLDPVDATGRLCAASGQAVTGTLQPQDDEGAERPELNPRASVRNSNGAAPSSGNDLTHTLLGHLMRTVEFNARLTELVVTRVPTMLDSASGLLAAADGAKLTTRTPMPVEPEPEAEPEPELESMDVLPAESPWFKSVLTDAAKQFAATIAEKLGATLSTLSLSEMLNWSKAAANAKPAAPAAAPPPPPAAPPSWSPVDPSPWGPSVPETDPASWEFVAPKVVPSVEVAIPFVAVPGAPMPAPVGSGVSAAGVSAPSMATAGPMVSVSGAPFADLATPTVPPPGVMATMAPRTAVESAPAAGSPVARAQTVSLPVASVPASPVRMSSDRAAPPVGPTSAPATRTIAPLGRPPAEPPRPDARAPSQALTTTRQTSDDSVPIMTHVTRVYEALLPQERALVDRLIDRLTQEERVQWLLELAPLSIPDAVARVRQVLKPRPTKPGDGAS